MLAVCKAMERRSLEDKKRMLREGLNICLEKGLTAVQTNDEGCVQAYTELLAEEEAMRAGVEAEGVSAQSMPIRVFLTPNYVEINEEGD